MNLKKLERHLRINLLGPGSRLIKKNLPGRGLTKVEKHCFKRRAKACHRDDLCGLRSVVSLTFSTLSGVRTECGRSCGFTILPPLTHLDAISIPTTGDYCG